MNTDRLREDLSRLADTAKPTSMDSARISRLVRRRRRVRAAAIGTAGFAIVAAATASISRHAGNEEAAQARGPANAVADSTDRTPAGGWPLRYICGQPLESTITRGGPEGLTATIASVHRAAHGAPDVTYALSASAPTMIASKPMVHLVVLRNGLVVAGQTDPAPTVYPDTPHRGLDMDLRIMTLTPGKPLVVDWGPMATVPCDGGSWDELTQGGYTIAAVITDWNPRSRDPEPLLATAPLQYGSPG